MEFTHPSFATQNIFFNKTYDRMIEVLVNFRAFILKREQIPGQPQHMIKWQRIRRIADYQDELQFGSIHLEFFSPCFSRYMCAEKKE